MCNGEGTSCYFFLGYYQYTLDSSLINEDQRRFYEDEGFLVIRGLVEKEQLETYRQRFQKICCKEVEVSNLGFKQEYEIIVTPFAGCTVIVGDEGCGYCKN